MTDFFFYLHNQWAAAVQIVQIFMSKRHSFIQKTLLSKIRRNLKSVLYGMRTDGKIYDTLWYYLIFSDVLKQYAKVQRENINCDLKWSSNWLIKNIQLIKKSLHFGLSSRKLFIDMMERYVKVQKENINSGPKWSSNWLSSVYG